MKIVVTDYGMPALPALAKVADRTGADLVAHRDAPSPATITRAVSDADVVMVTFVDITRDLLAAMRPGTLIIRYGIGVDNVDLAAAGEFGIRVANVPDYGTDVVADHATAMLLALLRRLPWYDREIRDRGWLRAAEVGHLPSVGSSTVGLVGGGRIALAVRERLRPFSCRVLVFDPFSDPANLARLDIEYIADPDELFQRSDAISLHAPATPDTYHLVNRDRLALMQAHAVLVNTARGTLIDSQALLDALDDGQLFAAALDVYEEEPLTVAAALTQHPRILHSPHAGFYSEQSLERLERLAAEEAERAVLGQPLRCELYDQNQATSRRFTDPATQ